MRNFQYSGDKYQLATGLLRSLGIPGYQSSVSITSHDTGYPGLVIPITEVGIYELHDKELEDLVCKLFQRIGFEQK